MSQLLLLGVSTCTQDKKVPRPYGETLRATKPNEILHFDFLSIPRSTSGTLDVLVLKDDMSGYVELLACDRPTSDAAYHKLINWFKRFGVVNTWVFDQGSHFASDVMGLVRHLFGAQHHFVTAYSPWANGAVEV
ncbi:LOW QUALITY PROTEIN: Retrotransposon protein [Phytophthora palmivora]|uniref:Retrotransposon protein n=1 Tax=Phytophthora palmivora TaxID=4796 RepID=A0A2P4XKX0_9STRA|nr:LOW QUALITY PROTEIN: Retrotransposon protein [Phytophthora palmivora]